VWNQPDERGDADAVEGRDIVEFAQEPDVAWRYAQLFFELPQRRGRERRVYFLGETARKGVLALVGLDLVRAADEDGTELVADRKQRHDHRGRGKTGIRQRHFRPGG
jgi:hypothetical protein